MLASTRETTRTTLQSSSLTGTRSPLESIGFPRFAKAARRTAPAPDSSAFSSARSAYDAGRDVETQMANAARLLSANASSQTLGERPKIDFASATCF